MSKIEDFKNAPVGATATREMTGGRAMKIDGVERRWIHLSGIYLDDEEMGDFTLDPLEPAPTTVHEALDLAWGLAHEVKEGQVIPKGTPYLMKDASGLREYTGQHDVTILPELVPIIRTVGPLSEPEWLDAPAVLAGFDGWSHDEREVFVPTGLNNHWMRVGSSLTSHWRDLRDVTPLYPKEGQDA